MFIPTLIVTLCLINNNIPVLIQYQGGVFSWPKIRKPLTRLYGQPKRKLIDDNPLKKIKNDTLIQNNTNERHTTQRFLGKALHT